MKVGIIGGGAAGLMCAINAARSNNQVTIYEKNNKCGKKILITGNGKCNYFNEDFTIDHYNSSNIDILSSIINEENKSKILDIFDSIGIIPKVVNGYYYPVSGQAVTVESALVNEALKLGVEIKYEVEVIDIEYNDLFIIKTNKGEFSEDKVVVSTGSLSAPKTGSDGKGYEIAKKFNHNVIKPLPSLVQLKGNEKYFDDWAGVRCDAKISLYEDDIKIKEVEGELQLTDYGVSGICIYQLSSKVVRGLDSNKKEEIVINFLPWLKEDIKTFLSDRNNKMKNRTISELLDGLLNYKLVNMILKVNNISYDKKFSDLTLDDINNICISLVSFKLEITGSNGFDKSQVTSGGIPLDEININTFGSKYQKGLYIIGELLDVDGECGGYNLGFAWLTGMLAGNSIGEKL